MRTLFSQVGAFFLVVASVHAATDNQKPLVSFPGDTAFIPEWSLQSATRVAGDITGLSKAGVNVSSWYRMSSRGTVIAGLLANGVYDEASLFFSENMKFLADDPVFQASWLYRAEVVVNPGEGRYFALKTHGVTPEADMYVNGVLIASRNEQRGSYGGRVCNLTGVLEPGPNCILIQAYPTDYRRDFALGFADWNPYPADNGTGIWRHVELSQTGAVSMSPLRVLIDFPKPGADTVAVRLRTKLENHSQKTLRATVKGTISAPNGTEATFFTHSVELNPLENKTVSIPVCIRDPQIWWPARWGHQPLYTVHANTVVQVGDENVLSDATSPRTFGIRHVSMMVNDHNDTAFSVNGWPFQVLGAGYAPDLFLRFDEDRVATIFRYMLDMGLNTMRLEGKQEHPELYDLADKMGLMVLAGWECCDKWEGWEYNEDADGVKWEKDDYRVARTSMLHEAKMMQPHPSMLGFLVGSDYWPNDRATTVYMEALREMDWQNPVIASASQRGYPEALGPSGMKMDGPYDWVPPNYWYGDQDGAAFGFGSELGTGVGTPEIGSLKRFLQDVEMGSLWNEPEAGLYHMSSIASSFNNRSIYNKALFARYGPPTSLEDYVLKCQMADYEATRAQFEAYSARKTASRPATGSIYWMLNSAWPSLHWQLFGYYLSPMGAYFGTKAGTRYEHVAYDYQNHSVWLINHSLVRTGDRQITTDLIGTDGKKISGAKLKTKTAPNTSKHVRTVSGLEKIKDVAFLRLALRDLKSKRELSRNVYWLSSKPDVLDWSHSNWYCTQVKDHADYTKLQDLRAATVLVTVRRIWTRKPGWNAAQVQLENKSKWPAVFLHLKFITPDGTEITPVYWTDNYVSLWPKEKLQLAVAFKGDLKHSLVELSGRNVEKQKVKWFKSTIEMLEDVVVWLFT